MKRRYGSGMKCQHCGSETVVKNGCRRHGRQRWRCLDCERTYGPVDQCPVASAKREAALAHSLDGLRLRATERLVGVSYNAVMNWVLAEVEGQVLAAAKAEEVTWVEADNLWTYAGPQKTACWLWWAIDRVSIQVCAWTLGGSWDRNSPSPGCAASARRPHHILHRLLVPLTKASSFAQQRHLHGKATHSPSKVTTTTSASISPVCDPKPIAPPRNCQPRRQAFSGICSRNPLSISNEQSRYLHQINYI